MQRLLTGGGITVTEIAPMDGPVEARAETVAAFVGRALRGPVNTPVLVDSFAAFERRFGASWRRSELGPAVEQYFGHGGRQLYVVRVANSARGAMLCLPAEHGVLVLRAVEPGSTESIRASVDYDGIAAHDREHFNLTLQRITPGTGLVADQEIYRQLSCDAEARGFIGNATAASELARPQLPLPSGRPMPTTDPGNRFGPGYACHVQAGTDGQPLSDYDLVGSSAEGTGIFALDQVESFDLLYMPPPAAQEDLGPAAILAAERYCSKRGAMLLLDPPLDWTSAAAAIAGVRAASYGSSNMLTYFPRLVRPRDDGPPRPSAGAFAGLLARLDRTHGTWQSLDRKGLRFGSGLAPAVTLTPGDVNLLVREGINAIVAQPGRPATVEGSVTLARNSAAPKIFASLGARRLCLAITGAVGRATRWAVFEPNEARVADRIRAQVHAYLSSLADAGAFADERFIVQCDAGLHVQPNDPGRGVTLLLAFRPAGADETVSLTLHQAVSGCRVAATAFAPATADCA